MLSDYLGERLKVGDKVVVKPYVKEYGVDAGKTKVITKILPNFGKLRVFALDGDDGIWCMEDFERVIFKDK